MINPIAGNKAELERLLFNLSKRGAIPTTPVFILLDAYISRLETRCLHLRRIDYAPVRNEILNMELTLTQNSALYLVQHKDAKARAAFFRRSRASASERRPDMQHQLAHAALRRIGIRHFGR